MKKINSSEEIEKLILKYVNISRKKRGLSSLKSNFGLKKVARNHSSKMANVKRIWHGNGVHEAKSSLNHKSIWDFFISLLYKGCSGENVGMMPKGRVKGFKHEIKTSKDVALAQHKAWMNSPGHKANILNSNFSLIGIGVKRNGKTYYCTELFYG